MHSSPGELVSIADINERLADVLEAPLTHPLSVTPIIEFVIRSARNMNNCITRSSTSALNAYGLYAAVSVLKILGGGGGGGALPFAFDSMMTVLKEHFPMDVRFFELLSSPMTQPNDDLRHEDSSPPTAQAKHRSSAVPTFRIGQIFQHAQLNYWAVICGWDLRCTAPLLWQIRMSVASLTRGSSQPFYHIVANDSSQRYVAEDNVNTSAFTSIESPEEKLAIVEMLCRVDGIGKYFQGVDLANARFVPTIELGEEYPDEFI